MKSSKISAKTLRAILSLTIVISIVLSGFAFYFAQNWLSSLSVEISDTVAQSDSSGNDIQSLKKLEEELASRQEIIKKASQLISPIDSYQTKTIDDINQLASKAGIKVLNYNFSKGKSTQAGTSNSQAEVIVSLGSPVSYVSLLKFLDAIESNIPKMQVSSLSVGKIAGDSTNVRADKITIKVYVN